MPTPRFARSAVMVTGLLWLAVPDASAVPSFARQTGLTCSACHTVFPQLTSFGRNFKLHGYTMLGSIQGQSPALQEAPAPPISLMLLVSHTRTNAAQPDSQNNTVMLPDQVSLFYSGRISGHAGAFLQLTYDGVADHVTMDNTDVRLTGSSGSTAYGLTVNNNPTVEDLWNSTPAWGFPFASSAVAPSPAAATEVDGTLAQLVAGLGGYTAWNNWLYADVTLYRSFQIGTPQPPASGASAIIADVAPYWRAAVFHTVGNHDIEAGTYGLWLKRFPGGGTPLAGPTDRFLDVALDAQYQYLSDPHTLTVRSTWIHERQDWNASFAAGATANPTDILRTFRANGTYFFRRRVGGSAGFFSTDGDTDPLLYPPGPVSGSLTGSPNSRGYIVEADCLPWQNTKFSLQYVWYTKFNGAAANYDGAGRNASANNTLYLSAWVAF
jgi:hypothetical protein